MDISQSVRFGLKADDVPTGRAVFIIGNVPQLGEWNLQSAQRLVPNESINDKVWSIDIEFKEADDNILYRYFIGFVSSVDSSIIVCNWEGSAEARCIESLNDEVLYQNDVYGVYAGRSKIKRGWLTKQKEIRLGLHTSPLTLWGRSELNDSHNFKLSCDKCSKTDNDVKKSQLFDEVHVFSYETGTSLAQPSEGVTLSADNCITFKVQAIETNIIFKFEISDSKTDLLGVSYIISSNIINSGGKIVSTVCDPVGKPIGQLQIEYLVITPLTNNICDLNMDYKKSWLKKKPLNIGHRGMGLNDPAGNSEYIENTIASLNKAFECGADFVEFDVHVSRDKIPIVYHDATVNISTKTKEKNEILQFPINYFTSDQLRNLPLKHSFLPDDVNMKFDNENIENMPFPPLKDIFAKANTNLGFNIEIKYSQLLISGVMEDSADYVMDRNEYADIILIDILNYAGDRHIIFSCFDPDMCTLLRAKQNRYEVLFLTHNQVDKWEPYRDSRHHNLELANNFAKLEQLRGLSVHSEDLVKKPEVIEKAKESDLSVFCWGQCDDSANDVTFLKSLDIDGIIVDSL